MHNSRHMVIAGVISCVLSLITIIAVSVTDTWDIRHIYNVVFFTLLSIVILTTNALFFTKAIRVTNTVIYVFIYLAASIVYMLTGQVLRTQTILFTLGVAPLFVILAMIALVLVFIGIIVYAIHKRTNDHPLTSKQKKGLLIVATAAKILLITTALTNVYFLNIEHDLTDESNLISYDVAPLLTEKLSRINDTYEGRNVVFILLESISAERVGTYGYPENVTPNIDALAEQSLVFDTAYSTATHSDYAQPAVLSSRYQLANTLRNTFAYDNPRTFVWDVFKEEGYTTGYFSSQDDRWQNMDEYIRTENLDVYRYSLTDRSYDYGFGLAQKDFDNSTSAEARTWLENVTEPYFLYVNFQATHDPFAVSPGYEKFEDKYDNALSYVDVQVGSILNMVDMNNTIVVITSDHGHDFDNRHDISGHGYSLYDEELVVPLIAYIPGAKPIRVAEAVSHIDVTPSLIDLMGYSIPADMQGGLMRKGKPMFFVTQNHKYLVGMVQNDLKVVVDLNRDLIEVYNLTEDPLELHSLEPEKYEQEVLRVLMWNHCQLDYYKNKLWDGVVSKRCKVSNNFS